MLRSGMRHETTADVGGDRRAHGRALDAPGKGVGVRGSDQRGHDVGLRQNLWEDLTVRQNIRLLVERIKSKSRVCLHERTCGLNWPGKC